ncbi:MAG: tetratricopeptide repeat protein [Candidatus Latescibacterota bacterium]|nr:MAG: tetratricopeptide repeat protein [Candidatus Latescibacterota bacterium]
MRTEALLLVRDEAHNLADCIHSLNSCVDRVTVFDCGSLDHTADVARELGARWVPQAWHENFATLRNQALESLDADWVLVIDADERLDVAARQAVRSAVASAGEHDTMFYLEVRTYTDDIESLGYVGLARGESQRRGAAGFVPRLEPRLLRLRRGLHYRGRVCERLHFANGEPVPLRAATLGILHHLRELEPIAAKKRHNDMRLRLALKAVLEEEEPEACGRLGVLLNQERRWSAALPYLHAAEERGGGNAALSLQMGVAQLALGLVEGAIASLRRAWSEIPDHPELATHLARALIRSARPQALDEAGELLERALEQDPELEQAVVQRAVLHRHRGEFDEARAYLHAILERNTMHALALKELGTVELLQDHLGEAEQHLRQAARMRPEDPEVWNNLGCALERRGLWREALSAFDRAVQLAPASERYLRNRCLAHAACGRLKGMCRDADQALLASDAPVALLDGLRESCLDAGWLPALRRLENWAVQARWLREEERIVPGHAVPKEQSA